MKRYLLFSMLGYYPSGGWDDFRGDYETLDEAIQAAAKCTLDFYHIVDTDDKEVIKQGRPESLKHELEVQEILRNKDVQEDEDIRFTDDDPWGVS